MPLSTACINEMLNVVFGGVAPTINAGFASLHTDDPGDTGLNEVTGGSPAYARKAIGWDAASGKAISQNGTPVVFDVPAGTTVSYVGYWSAAVGGTFLGFDPVTPETFAGQGQYSLNDTDVSIT